MDYNWLLPDSDADKSEYDCSNLDDFVEDCVWQPLNLLMRNLVLIKNKLKKNLFSNVLHNFETDEDEEDSNDEHTVDNISWTNYIRRHKLFPFSDQVGLLASILQIALQ